MFLFAAQLCAAAPVKETPQEGDAGKRSVSDADVTAFEREAMKCRMAADALDMYREFIAGVQLTARQKQTVLDRQKVWQDRVDRKLVRLGTEWVTLDSAKGTAKKADEFIEQAFAKIKDGDYKTAKVLLEKAVKQDPAGVRADYYLGMLNTPNFWNYAPAAEKNFERAHKRDPENAAISNNLALSKLKMGRFSDALDLWGEALRFAPEAPEVVQNLGRFVNEATANRLNVTDSHVKRGKRLYEKSLADKKGPPVSEKTGWLYAPVTLSLEERERSQAPQSADEEAAGGATAAKPKITRTLHGFGTGFVIRPGFILSNRHVAKGGTSYGAFQPAAVFQEGEPAKEHEATVAALADELDLAVFRCEPLPAPAVTLNVKPPRRTSEILVLGFPFGDALGASIKAVRGTVFGFEDDAKRQIMMYEATTNPGNSGGPVCDNTGRVVAVHFAGLNLAAVEKGAGKMGMGIPIEAALPFLTKTLPELTPGDAADAASSGEKGDKSDNGDKGASPAKLEWPDIDAAISKSVVLMKLYVETLPLVERPPTARSINVFEDCTCTACKGRDKVPCPVKGCYKGSVAEFESSYSVGGIGAGAQVLKWETPRNRACKGCKGAGVIDCPHCANGLDPALVPASNVPASNPKTAPGRPAGAKTR
jgi:S1-C subfamily serine protease